MKAKDFWVFVCTSLALVLAFWMLIQGLSEPLPHSTNEDLTSRTNSNLEYAMSRSVERVQPAPLRSLPPGITSVRQSFEELRTNYASYSRKVYLLTNMGYPLSEVEAPMPKPESSTATYEWGVPDGQDFGQIMLTFRAMREHYGSFPAGKSPDITRSMIDFVQTNYNGGFWPPNLTSNGALLDSWSNPLEVETFQDGRILIRSAGASGMMNDGDDIVYRQKYVFKWRDWYPEKW